MKIDWQFWAGVLIILAGALFLTWLIWLRVVVNP